MASTSGDCSAIESIFSHFRLTRTGTDCCYWTGVTCSGGQVTQLRLNGRKLSGSIPARSIASLSTLETLHLHQNDLEGRVPSELGNLSNLRDLRLWRNRLSGNLPRELGRLSKLQWLGLGTNKLSGTIPSELGNLGNLLELWLEHNQFEGELPGTLSNLARLESLYITNNTLSGPISRLPNPSVVCAIMPMMPSHKLCISQSLDRSGRCWDHLAQYSLASCPTEPTAGSGQTGAGTNLTTIVTGGNPAGENGPGTRFPLAAVAGIAASAVVTIGLIVLALFINHRRRRSRTEQDHPLHLACSDSSSENNPADDPHGIMPDALRQAPIVFHPAPMPESLAYPPMVPPPFPPAPRMMPMPHLDRPYVMPAHPPVGPPLPHQQLQLQSTDMYMLPPATMKPNNVYQDDMPAAAGQFPPHPLPPHLAPKKRDVDDDLFIA